MKTILTSTVIVLICCGAFCAQGVTVSSSPVSDYASFKKYVELEQSKVKVKPVTIDNGEVRNKLKNMGMEFSPNTSWIKSKDKKRIAYLSPDRKGLAVIDGVTRTVNIFDPNGKILHKIPVKNPIEGLLGFSGTRLFDFKGGFGDREGGFYIYDFNGQLVKKVVDCGIVDRFAVSNGQKYFAITSGSPKSGDHLSLYDMNGERIWRAKVDNVGDSEIIFSQDDKFLLLKLPGIKTVYLFSGITGDQISKEQYAN